MKIAKREIGGDNPCYVIAELSCNHGGIYDQAVNLVRAAADADADAVKLQTYTADTMTLPVDNRFFRIKGTAWNGRSLYDLYQEAATPWEWIPELKKLANKLGMALFSSPFDASAVAFLEMCDVPAYKVASFEIVDIPLLRHIAKTGKPVIMSTGMATWAEVVEAYKTLTAHGSPVAVLRCVSSYPAMPEDAKLGLMQNLAIGLHPTPTAGLSDHTLGSDVTIAAVALGAKIIEKHLIISRHMPYLDAKFSMEPHEFKAMVSSIHRTEKACRGGLFEPSKSEIPARKLRRSLFAIRDVKVGETLTDSNVRSIRPGYGLHPRHLQDVIGQTAAVEVKMGTPLSWKHVASAGVHRRRPAPKP